jgi:hypothetical protein
MDAKFSQVFEQTLSEKPQFLEDLWGNIAQAQEHEALIIPDHVPLVLTHHTPRSETVIAAVSQRLTPVTG